MKRKLNDKQVQEIRRSDRTAKELAYDYNVSRPTITRIKNGTRRKTKRFGSDAGLLDCRIAGLLDFPNQSDNPAIQ